MNRTHCGQRLKPMPVHRENLMPLCKAIRKMYTYSLRECIDLAKKVARPAAVWCCPVCHKYFSQRLAVPKSHPWQAFKKELLKHGFDPITLKPTAKCDAFVEVATKAEKPEIAALEFKYNNVRIRLAAFEDCVCADMWAEAMDGDVKVSSHGFMREAFRPKASKQFKDYITDLKQTKAQLKEMVEDTNKDTNKE